MQSVRMQKQTGTLHLLERLASRTRVEGDDLVQAHDLEERLRVHALRGRPVGAGLLERAHGGPDAVHGSNTGDQREDWARRSARCRVWGGAGELTDDFGTHVLRLLAGERRGEAAGDDVDEDGLGREGGDGALEEIRGLDALDEADIRTRVGGELQADDGLVHAEHLGRVRAADDDL